MWKETTEQGDPLTKDGEWSLELPWLKSNYMPSRYTIRKNGTHYVTCFWHGNQGHDFDNHSHYIDKSLAMKAVREHMNRMLTGIDVMLEKL